MTTQYVEHKVMQLRSISRSDEMPSPFRPIDDDSLEPKLYIKNLLNIKQTIPEDIIIPMPDKVEDTTVCEYESIHKEFTIEKSRFPEIFKKSKNCENIIILKDDQKGATDVFKNLTGLSFKDTLLDNSKVEMKLFEEKDLNNIESNFCYPFMRCLEMNKIIETCKDIESDIIGSNGKNKIVPAGTIFYNINELNFFKNKNLICVFNKFDKRKIYLIDIDFFLKRRHMGILDNKKRAFVDIITNFKRHNNSILFGGQILKNADSISLSDIIKTYLRTQTKGEYYNNIGLNNVIGVKGMTLSVPSLQKIDPENFSKIFTPIYKPNSGIFNIKLCDHIFNDRRSRLELGLSSEKNEIDFKNELVNIIENGIYLVVLNYKVYNINFGKDTKVKYLCLEMSNYHSSIDKNLSVISLITIDNLFFEYAKKLDRESYDKSQFGTDLENGNRKMTKNLKCNHIEELRPIRIGEMQINSKFIKYSHYPEDKVIVIRVYKITSFKEFKTPIFSSKLVNFEECIDEIKIYEIGSSNIFEPLNTWDKLNSYESYESKLTLSENFPVLALVNSFTKDEDERYPKEFSIECPDKENGLINCGVTAVNTNMMEILQEHQAWIM